MRLFSHQSQFDFESKKAPKWPQLGIQEIYSIGCMRSDGWIYLKFENFVLIQKLA